MGWSNDGRLYSEAFLIFFFHSNPFSFFMLIFRANLRASRVRKATYGAYWARVYWEKKLKSLKRDTFCLEVAIYQNYYYI